MSAFRVGQKVQCINGAPADHGGRGYFPGVVFPVKGNVYVVEGIVGIRLIIGGCPNPGSLGITDFGWFKNRFRPLITRTQAQDLELFLPLLTKVGEPA